MHLFDSKRRTRPERWTETTENDSTERDDTLIHPIMTDSNTLGIRWGTCEGCGEDKPDVLRVGLLTDKRTLCRECRRKDRGP